MPFWIGCVVTPVLLLGLLSALGSLRDSFAFWLFVCVVPPIFGPVGGMFFQAIHDLFIARQQRLLRVLDLVVLLAICMDFVIAGYISLHTPGKDGIADIAGTIAAILIWFYARRRCG